MRTARIIAAAAGFACAVTAAHAFAQAAPNDLKSDTSDGDLYLVNGTHRTVELIVDNARLGELAAFSIRHVPTHAGGHGLAVVALGHVVSTWQQLDVHNVTLNAPGHPSWCAVIRDGEHLSDPLAVELLDPHECRLLVHDGGPTRDVAGGP